VPGARLIEIEGMGHDLEGPLAGMVADHAVSFMQTVGAGAQTPKD
jgi:hypothetical protein